MCDLPFYNQSWRKKYKDDNHNKTTSLPSFRRIWRPNYYEQKIKLWWSTIPPILTKQTITSLLNSLITNSLITKKTTTYNVAIPDPGVGQAQACGGVNPDSGIHTLPSYFVFFVLLLLAIKCYYSIYIFCLYTFGIFKPYYEHKEMSQKTTITDSLFFSIIGVFHTKLYV
jgi:hypothetical protein